MGVMNDRATVAIRASQGHIEKSGAADDVLPVAEDLMTIIHGTTLAADRSIVHDGLSKAGRLHVHFYESDLEGRPVETVPPAKLSSESIVVVSAEKCDRFGLVCYRAANGVISTPGVDGVVPAQCILCVRRVSDYAALWFSLSQRWGSRSAPALGSNFGSRTDVRNENRRTTPRRALGPASSSRDPHTRTGVLAEDEDAPTYRVETTEQRSRGRGAGQEEDRGEAPGSATPAMQVQPQMERNTGGEIRMEKETTVLEMRMFPETGAENTTITRTVQTGVITRPVASSECIKIEIDSDSEEGDTPFTDTCLYQETQTSSYRSSEADHPISEAITDQRSEQPQWRMGETYYLDSTHQQAHRPGPTDNVAQGLNRAPSEESSQ